MLFALAFTLARSAAAQRSDFTHGTEGWTVIGDAVGPVWTGGAISATDLDLDAEWYWEAPCGFLGNKSNAYGQYIRCVRQVTGGGPGTVSEVVLQGAGLSIGANLGGAPGGEWFSKSIQLVPQHWHKLEPGWPVVTASEMQAVLADLTAFRIKGEYAMGGDVGYLDNVVLEPVDPPIDLPSAVCQGEGVVVHGHSLLHPLYWHWSFPGGTPAYSNQQHPPSIHYYEPGIFPVQLTVTNACNAVLYDVGQVKVMPTYVIDTAFTLCYGEGYPFDGGTLTQPGTYFGMLETVHGCDSAVTVEISVRPQLFGEADIVPVHCPGLPEGIVTVSPSGGTPPYSAALVGHGSTVQGFGTFNHLYADAYDYVIT
ncbi:MAG TPA: laminin B domain-containing protein, partial [Flavobacteriales bacterium]|nr:laminin B domain-containing protein [Flavobacteriales bacterium]